MNPESSPYPPYRKPWNRCVGSDRLSTMLRQEYWERFDAVQSVMRYQFIRCHGLFGDELGVIRMDDWQGTRRITHNFVYLDQIFDTMLAHGVKPFVELGFMPQALASGPETVFWWQGNTSPPSDWRLWAELIDALFRHWIRRYGAEQVRTWPVEVWNEPNLTQFWARADQAAYFRLYETTVRAIKAVDAAIPVGGPAICGGSDHWIDDFLAFVRREALPLDFFTRHLYSGQTPSLRTPELLYQSLAEPSVPLQELQQVRDRIDAAGFAGLELHITEFNTSYHPLCPVHDTPLNAAHLAQLLSEAGDWVSSLSYWTFSDLFEEADIPRGFFHGGFGLLARGGVPKPTFHLFAFFQNHGEEILHRDAVSLITRRVDGTLVMTAWNPVQVVPAPAPLVVERAVEWTSGRALVRRSRVHEEAANPWGLWIALGRPRNPDPATVEFLRQAAHPQLETALIEPAGNTLSLRFTLNKNEVTLLEIAPFEDESALYLGLDDGRIDGYPSLPFRPSTLS